MFSFSVESGLTGNRTAGNGSCLRRALPTCSLARQGCSAVFRCDRGRRRRIHGCAPFRGADGLRRDRPPAGAASPRNVRRPPSPRVRRARPSTGISRRTGRTSRPMRRVTRLAIRSLAPSEVGRTSVAWTRKRAAICSMRWTPKRSGSRVQEPRSCLWRATSFRRLTYRAGSVSPRSNSRRPGKGRSRAMRHGISTTLIPMRLIGTAVRLPG
ncbi:hypothetical protein SAMN04515660_1549 [Luteibacter sp. 329MFSha]|nr:hypothetical protein SAMN04515660_1549 [Luteibacter sp. 329MFSha]